MALYVTRCALEVNGNVVTDFKGFTEKARVIRKQVPLMYKTGHAELTQRFSVDVDYVVPQVAPFDFDTVKGGTLTIEFDSGDRIDFGGVYTLDIGDATIDGEAELVKKVTLGCETRNGLTGASV
jgi:hypothetical protein